MGNLILEVSVKVQCTFNTVVVLRHTVPPLKKNCQLWGNYSNDWVELGK